MATYAIGDIHGCFRTLRLLLRRIAFDRRHDRLWLVGDLVNRGPRSLAVLRWAADLDDRAVAVLGNHDLHLLAYAEGIAEARRRDSLEEVLTAPDRDELLAWLRSRPLVHREDGHLLVHAGLFPEWSAETAEVVAREVEAELRRGPAHDLLAAVESKTAERWESGLAGADRVRVALAGFARLRTLDESGRMCAGFSGPPRDAPRGCRPWYEHPERRSTGVRVIFGHWAALGLKLGEDVAALDTGCAWGNALTALRLEDGAVFQEKAAEG
jgi:bis(5'-nucleosyl)-tetraphosphatase (symmetrical)